MILNDVPERDSVEFVVVDYHVDAIKAELPADELKKRGYEPGEYNGFCVERNCWHELWNVWGFFDPVGYLHQCADPILVDGKISEHFQG